MVVPRTGVEKALLPMAGPNRKELVFSGEREADRDLWSNVGRKIEPQLFLNFPVLGESALRGETTGEQKKDVRRRVLSDEEDFVVDEVLLVGEDTEVEEEAPPRAGAGDRREEGSSPSSQGPRRGPAAGPAPRGTTPAGAPLPCMGPPPRPNSTLRRIIVDEAAGAQRGRAGETRCRRGGRWRSAWTSWECAYTSSRRRFEQTTAARTLCRDLCDNGPRCTEWRRYGSSGTPDPARADGEENRAAALANQLQPVVVS